MANELIPANRGLGNWLFEIYNPNKMLGPVKGYLVITKDHHTIYEDSKLNITLLNIPSQNVAWVRKVEA
jgi:hypothetical protein